MKNSRLFALLLSLTSVLGISQVSLSQIRTSFTGEPPKLLEADVTHNYVRSRLARYYFTLEVPADTQQSLKKITLQGRRSPEYINFNLDKTQAFLGTRGDSDEEIAIESVTENPETRTIAVSFENPIPPGTRFTVSLKPNENPSSGGYYLIAVTAFPEGEYSSGLNLGLARLFLARPRG